MIFDELDQRLSTVPRWVVCRTIQKQSVAEHCFNVERIAMGIAVEWFGVTKPRLLFDISQFALHHDDEEAITGDIPGPAKRKRFDAKTTQPAPDFDGTYKIVKLADHMEAVWFLAMEKAMGNYYIKQHYANTVADASNYCEEHFDERICILLSTWLLSMATLRSESYD
jgi:hypothetical protein